jgi:hypothetical protein
MAGTIASLRILEGRQGIENREQRTEIREQRTEIREQRSENRDWTGVGRGCFWVL